MPSVPGAFRELMVPNLVRTSRKGRNHVQNKRIARLTGIGILTVMAAVSAATAEQGSGTILKPAELQKLIPATVFYREQTASTQLRNSAGVRFSDGYVVLVAMVDTSGYASGVTAKYQAQLITEVPIQVGDKHLPAGVYGIGFVANNKFLVTDVGAHEVFNVTSATNSEMKQPRPLEVLPNPSGGFRLYVGRRYVVLKR